MEPSARTRYFCFPWFRLKSKTKIPGWHGFSRYCLKCSMAVLQGAFSLHWKVILQFRGQNLFKKFPIAVSFPVFSQSLFISLFLSSSIHPGDTAHIPQILHFHKAIKSSLFHSSTTAHITVGPPLFTLLFECSEHTSSLTCFQNYIALQSLIHTVIAANDK